MLPEIVEIDAGECTRGSMRPARVAVSAEYAITLIINGSPLMRIACSGADLEELATGYLLSERILLSVDEIESVEVDPDHLTVRVNTRHTDQVLDRLFRVPTLVSGCGHAASSTDEREGMDIAAGVTVRAGLILECMRRFLGRSSRHKQTHGVHSAALYASDGAELAFFDEIGRHNAVDKIIGHAARRGFRLAGTLLFSTGRLSSEIVHKARGAAIPVLVSKSAPTSLGVTLAQRYGLVMIGRVTGSRFIAFSGSEHISIEPHE